MAILYRKAQEGLLTKGTKSPDGVPTDITQATNKMQGIMSKKQPKQFNVDDSERIYSVNEARQKATVPGGGMYNWVEDTLDKAAQDYYNNFAPTTDPNQIAGMMNTQFNTMSGQGASGKFAPAHYAVDPVTGTVKKYLRPASALPNAQRFTDPKKPAFDNRIFQNMHNAGQIYYPKSEVTTGGIRLKDI